MRLKRSILAAAAVLTLAGGTAALSSAPAAHATIPATVVALPALGTSAANPLGMTLNAKNWAGIGNSSTCTTGAGVSNTPIGVWAANTAGCASDWQVVPDPTPGTFQLEYNPSIGAPGGLCISTISNSPGTFVRLRPCAANGNIWQTFVTAPASSDITGGVFIEVAANTSLSLNDAAYRLNSKSQVIVWPTGGTGNLVNEIWASIAGPGLPV